MTLPSSIPTISPTTDVLIIIAVAATTIIGSMIGHARLKLLIMSMYVGAGMALLAVPLAHSMLGNPGGIASLLNIQVAVFGLTIGILGLTGGNAYHRATHTSAILNLVIAATGGFLLVVLTLSLMDAGTLKATTNASTLASMIYDTRLTWFLISPILLMLGGLIHGKRH